PGRALWDECRARRRRRRSFGATRRCRWTESRGWCRGLLCFVGLQVADEMPGEAQVFQRLDLVQPLLHAVLAELRLTCRCRRADVVRGKCLGYGNQGDVRGVAAGTLRRRVDAAAHVTDVLRNVRRRRHCYLICARIAFAVSAFGPVGASFRYSWKFFFASAITPRFRFAMPR